MPWLINAAQLDKFRKNQKNIVIFDASFHLDPNRNAKEEFLQKHIIDSLFFDIDAFSDQTSDIPHKLILDEHIINERLSNLGIRKDYKIIFYDNSELHSACRALWMMKVFGHHTNQLYLLDGGLQAFEQYGGKIESGPVNTAPKPYQSQLQLQYLRTLQQMKQNLQHPSEQVIDLRHPVRYAGGPEIRPGMRQGHIPGAFCLPYFTLFDKNHNLQPLEKIRKQFIDVAIDFNKPIISMCGGGITACTLDFVLDLMNHSEHAVYPGSWSEWGNDKLYSGEQSLDERPVESCTNN